jgi:hypothetical protein
MCSHQRCFGKHFLGSRFLVYKLIVLGDVSW